MSKARLVITALFVEHESPAEVADRDGVHRSWVYKLKSRYEAEGDAAFEPRSRRPKTSPTAISEQTRELIVQLRLELTGKGLDAGPDTIAWHLAQHHDAVVSPVTISRTLTRAGLVEPAPKKPSTSEPSTPPPENSSASWKSAQNGTTNPGHDNTRTCQCRFGCLRSLERSQLSG